MASKQPQLRGFLGVITQLVADLAGNGQLGWISGKEAQRASVFW